MNFTKKIVELDNNKQPITEESYENVLKKLYVYELIGNPTECANAINIQLDSELLNTNKDIVKYMQTREKMAKILGGLINTYEWSGYDKDGNFTGGEGCAIEYLFEDK